MNFFGIWFCTSKWIAREPATAYLRARSSHRSKRVTQLHDQRPQCARSTSSFLVEEACTLGIVTIRWRWWRTARARGRQRSGGVRKDLGSGENHEKIFNPRYLEFAAESRQTTERGRNPWKRNHEISRDACAQPLASSLALMAQWDFDNTVSEAESRGFGINQQYDFQELARRRNTRKSAAAAVDGAPQWPWAVLTGLVLAHE